MQARIVMHATCECVCYTATASREHMCARMFTHQKDVSMRHSCSSYLAESRGIVMKYLVMSDTHKRKPVTMETRAGTVIKVN